MVECLENNMNLYKIEHVVVWALALLSVAQTAQHSNYGQRLAKREAPRMRNLICYYNNRATERQDVGKLTVDQLDPNLCTHIIYGYATLSDRKLIQLSESESLGPMKDFRRLRAKNENLKLLMGISSRDGKARMFSAMAGDRLSREGFVRSVAQLLDRYGLDGLAIDWEFPGSEGENGSRQLGDKQNFIQLLRDLRIALNSKYIITALVPNQEADIKAGYDVPQVSRYLDLIIMKTFDYKQANNSKPAHLSPLYSSRAHDLPNKVLANNVNSTVGLWLDAGAPVDKLVLSVPIHGTSFVLENGRQVGMGTATRETPRAGRYTKSPGFLGYNEICELIQGDGWIVDRDRDFRAPFARNGPNWISFEDEESVAQKALYANSVGLAGVAVISLDTDSQSKVCHHDTYHLTRVIKRSLLADGLATRSLAPQNQGFANEVPRRPTNIFANVEPTFSPSASTSRPTTPATLIPVEPLRETPVVPEIPREERPSPPPRETFVVPEIPREERPSPPPRETFAVTGIPQEERPNLPPSLLQPIDLASSVISEENPKLDNLSPPVCGANGQWYFRGPTCRYYYDCTGGRPNLVKCRDNLVWKQDRLWCDHRYNVPECNVP